MQTDRTVADLLLIQTLLDVFGLLALPGLTLRDSLSLTRCFGSEAQTPISLC